MTALNLAAALAADLGIPVSTADAPRLLSGLQHAYRQGHAAASALPAVLWGFFWSDCIYEGGPVLQSLHRSKRAALQAMIRDQSARWDAGRDNRTPSVCRRPRCDGDYREFRKMEGFFVRPVEVLP